MEKGNDWLQSLATKGGGEGSGYQIIAVTGKLEGLGIRGDREYCKED